MKRAWTATRLIGTIPQPCVGPRVVRIIKVAATEDLPHIPGFEQWTRAIVEIRGPEGESTTKLDTRAKINQLITTTTEISILRLDHRDEKATLRATTTYAEPDPEHDPFDASFGITTSASGNEGTLRKAYAELLLAEHLLQVARHEKTETEAE